MYQAPLFNEHILANLWNYFYYTFTVNNLFVYFLLILSLLFINFVLVHFFFYKEETQLLSTEKYQFCQAPSVKWWGVGALGLSFFAYIFATLTQENSVLNNFDLMSVSAIAIMNTGIFPAFDAIRFVPLSHIDFNVVYALTNNFFVVNCWVILKQVLCLYLLYRFFSYISVTRRLFLLSVINFLPAVFVVNNMIYAEQMILIYVLLSFMALNKYTQTHKAIYLFWFVICVNLALYTKESIAFFYVGLLIYMLIVRILKEEINFNSFFSPLKTIARMPIEYMLFWSLFIFANCYLLLKDPMFDGVYLSTHQAPLPVIIAINKLILILNLIALGLWLVKNLKKGDKNNYLLSEGVVLASSILTCAIVFYMRIVAIPDYYKSYYLYLPAVFLTAYIFYNLRSPKCLIALFVPIILYSGFVNSKTYEREEGKYRRDIGEFIISLAQNKADTMNVYMYSEESIHHKYWKVSNWAASIKYLCPNDDIVIKTTVSLNDMNHPKDDRTYEIRITPQPEIGDYVLVHKFNSADFKPELNYDLVYENKVYAIYWVKDMDELND